MKRLKSTNQAPPNGWLYVQRETNWVSHLVVPASQWDYNLLCQSIKSHRSANPNLKLNTSLPAIQEEVMRVNSDRVAAIPGADIYLMDVGIAQPSSFPVAPKVTLLSAVNAAGAALKVGKNILLDFEESGQPPVSQEVANKRAEICVACPKNVQGGLSRFFTIPVAALLKARLEKLHSLKMTTLSDSALGICDGCLCVNRLKVWTPIEFIKQHTPPDIIAALDPSCWVLSETNPIEKEETSAIAKTKS